MRKFILYTILLCLQFTLPESSYATSTPAGSVSIEYPGSLNKKISQMKMKDLKKALGRKLTFKEKIAFLVLKHKAKKAESKDEGESALTMGFISIGLLLVGLFVPYVIIGAFVAAILALVMGGMAKKQGSDNRKAKLAQLLGGITLISIAVIILAAVLLVAAIFG